MEVVAPLAGSVDRNTRNGQSAASTRVAPLAGSVDRNRDVGHQSGDGLGRSPRGERG